MKQRLILPDGAIKVRLPDLSGYWSLAAKPARARSMQKGLLLPRQSLKKGIPDGSIYVDAPDLPQPTSWSCALAAASLARLYGVGPDSVDEFMKGMKTKRSGTNPSGIVDYLNSLGLKARIERNMSDIDLMDLLDEEISTILALQAWASDPTDYDEPKNCDNGHYVAAIGYASEPPTLESSVGEPRRYRRIVLAAPKQSRENYFYFMDPSILCRYGFMSWTNLDRRWHDNEGTRKRPKLVQHMGIVVDPNGHEPIHGSVADEIL